MDTCTFDPPGVGWGGNCLLPAAHGGIKVAFYSKLRRLETSLSNIKAVQRGESVSAVWTRRVDIISHLLNS